MLIDSHCHLDFFDISLRDIIIKRACDVDVKYMMTIGTNRESFVKIYNIVDKYDSVFGAIGLHPHEAEIEGIISFEELFKFVRHNKIIAIGETGLDYSREKYDKDKQIENFLNHIFVAQITGLPLVIHNRNSDDDMCDILVCENKKKPFKAIIHCFTGSLKMLNVMLDNGFYISASGIITFKNACNLAELFARVPISRLLLETDSPYLAPIPYRGKQNEPSYVVETAKKLANICHVSFDDICKITTDNFNNLFGLNLF